MSVADTIIRHSQTMQSNVLNCQNSVLEFWFPINFTFRPLILLLEMLQTIIWAVSLQYNKDIVVVDETWFPEFLPPWRCC